jgi:hypothetical protein
VFIELCSFWYCYWYYRWKEAGCMVGLVNHEILRCDKNYDIQNSVGSLLFKASHPSIRKNSDFIFWLSSRLSHCSYSRDGVVSISRSHEANFFIFDTLSVNSFLNSDCIRKAGYILNLIVSYHHIWNNQISTLLNIKHMTKIVFRTMRHNMVQNILVYVIVKHRKYMKAS